MADVKVVIVDDDKMMRKLLETLLKKEGYQVFIACNGEEGLDRVSEIRPDIVILDVRMPKMDGFEALEALKQDESTKDIPVIMLTSLGLDEDVNRGMSLGAARYLTKPMQSDLLLESLKAVLASD